MGDISVWAEWFRARVQARVAQRDQRGFTAVEWLLIALG